MTAREPKTVIRVIVAVSGPQAKGRKKIPGATPSVSPGIFLVYLLVFLGGDEALGRGNSHNIADV